MSQQQKQSAAEADRQVVHVWQFDELTAARRAVQEAHLRRPDAPARDLPSVFGELS